MPDLAQRLHEQLSNSAAGQLSFAKVMETALYDPELGYYGRGPRQLGRSGDFFTSVSVGPLFGRLLAEFARQSHATDEPLHVIEQAAHDGQLAEDLLQSLPATAKYTIIEPAPAFQKAQQERLGPSFGDQVEWLRSMGDWKADAGQAVFVCNELIDAMPVHVVSWNGSRWIERGVKAGADGSFDWTDMEPTTEALQEELKTYPDDLPDGYTTEVNIAMLDWIRELAAAPFHGKIVIADYGLDTEELFSPSRSTGTLRRYRNHQTDDEVLSDLGECDVTTHIHFSRLIQEAEACGLRVESYEDQGRWLTRVATPWLQSLEGAPPDAQTRALLRQFQTLTHPQFMGRSFRVLVLEKEHPSERS